MSISKSNNTTFGEMIRFRRVAAGRSQAEMARCLGIPQSAYARIESNARGVKLEEAIAIAKELGTSLEDMFNGSPEEQERRKREDLIDDIEMKIQEVSIHELQVIAEIVDNMIWKAVAIRRRQRVDPSQEIIHRFVSRMTDSNNPSPADLADEILADHPQLAQFKVIGDDVEYTLKDGRTYLVTNDSDFFSVSYQDGERHLERIVI